MCKKRFYIWIVYEVQKEQSQQTIIFKSWTLIRILTYLNYTPSLICNFKDVVSCHYFYFLYMLYFWYIHGFYDHFS